MQSQQEAPVSNAHPAQNRYKADLREMRFLLFEQFKLGEVLGQPPFDAWGPDEIVMVLEGRTTIVFLTDDGELAAALGPNELVIVPQATWHRFETPEGVKVLSVTPQPTDHSPDLPS